MAIVALTAVVYRGSLDAPFIFDDVPAIQENWSIRQLWPLAEVLSPPAGAGGAAGRPLVNLSLALNYAAGGLEVRGYHLFNLLLHLGSSLALFGLIRRTLLQPVFQDRFVSTALPLAFSTTLIWAVHALQTESVVCVAQRTELLVGVFYLLTFYCFVRGVGSARPALWLTLATAACLLGVTCKEVMVSAPLLVLLYDRTFIAGTFAHAWRQRWRCYLGLGASWLLLGYLMGTSHQRGGTVGFGLGVGSWHYLLTQCQALTQYLQLSLWPQPLVLDYGTAVVTRFGQVWPQALLIGALLLGVALALCRRPLLGFSGAAFFAVLAPSSSVVPLTTQTTAEHRMYLPLAAVLILANAGLHRWLGRQAFAASLVIAVSLGALTVRRIEDYRSALAIWSDTAAKCPANARAHDNLGIALERAGRRDEAIVHYRRALELSPGYAIAHNDLGVALYRTGQLADALAHYEQAARLDPTYAGVHNNWGAALLDAGRGTEAIGHFEQALRLQPDYPDAHRNLGSALVRAQRVREGLAHYARALALRPEDAATNIDLGNAFVAAGQPGDALPYYQRALVLQPESSQAHNDLAIALEMTGHAAEAIPHYEQALRLDPRNADCEYNLALAWRSLGRTAEAKAHHDAARRMKPQLPALQFSEP